MIAVNAVWQAGSRPAILLDAITGRRVGRMGTIWGHDRHALGHREGRSRDRRVAMDPTGRGTASRNAHRRRRCPPSADASPRMVGYLRQPMRRGYRGLQLGLRPVPGARRLHRRDRRWPSLGSPWSIADAIKKPINAVIGMWNRMEFTHTRRSRCPRFDIGPVHLGGQHFGGGDHRVPRHPHARRWRRAHLARPCSWVARPAPRSSPPRTMLRAIVA